MQNLRFPTGGEGGEQCVPNFLESCFFRKRRGGKQRPGKRNSQREIPSFRRPLPPFPATPVWVGQNLCPRYVSGPLPPVLAASPLRFLLRGAAKLHQGPPKFRRNSLISGDQPAATSLYWKATDPSNSVSACKAAAAAEPLRLQASRPFTGRGVAVAAKKGEAF